MKDKRLHGDPDRIMEHAEAGYCLSHSEELHLCKYTRSIRSALAEKTAAWEEAWHKIEWLRAALKRQFWRAQAERSKVERLRGALSRSQGVMELGRVWAGTKWKYPVIGMATVYDENEEALSATAPAATEARP